MDPPRRSVQHVLRLPTDSFGTQISTRGHELTALGAILGVS